MHDVTCGIKTLMRPAQLHVLLDSIYAKYPAMRCVVVDDSESPTLRDDYPHRQLIDYITLPFDTGLGASRNVMIDAVRTKYCLYLDDDFQFCPLSNIEYFKSILDADIADIVGGQVREGRHIRKYHGLLTKRGTDLIYARKNRGTGVHQVNDCVLTYQHVDIVLNFFLGVTSQLRKVGWDPELKINTHTKFFWDAKQAATRVVFCPHVRVLHRPHRSRAYAKLRNRKFKMRGLAKHGITRVRYVGGKWR